jgi:hypothetical protein
MRLKIKISPDQGRGSLAPIRAPGACLLPQRADDALADRAEQIHLVLPPDELYR